MLRKPTRSTILSWGRDLTLLFLALYSIIWWQSRDMLPTDGSAAIDPLVLRSLSGEVTTIGPDPERTTLVYFFAPWCGVCRNSISHLTAVDPLTTRTVIIALDYDDVAAVQQFVDDTGTKGTIYLGTPNVKAIFQVQGYPSYYLLDQAFRVIDKSMGYLTIATLRLGV